MILPKFSLTVKCAHLVQIYIFFVNGHPETVFHSLASVKSSSAGTKTIQLGNR